jgi:2-oxoglutarate ferredoxin oxidoreductase subunit gamma
MRVDVRVYGIGGQGIVTMGYVIGRAAALYDKKYAVMTEAYGPEITGGFSRADVIISDIEIDYPLIEKPDVLVVMSQDGWERNRNFVKKSGLVIFEEDMVDPGNIESRKFIPIPAMRLADEMGQRVVANVIIMGLLQEVANVITKGALEKALKDRIPKGTEKLNMRALEKGYMIGKDAGGWSP